MSERETLFKHRVNLNLISFEQWQSDFWTSILVGQLKSRQLVYWMRNELKKKKEAFYDGEAERWKRELIWRVNIYTRQRDRDKERERDVATERRAQTCCSSLFSSTLQFSYLNIALIIVKKETFFVSNNWMVDIIDMGELNTHAHDSIFVQIEKTKWERKVFFWKFEWTKIREI